MSGVKRHVSCVTCQVSCVQCHNVFFDKLAEQVGGGSVINGAYPIIFLRALTSSTSTILALPVDLEIKSLVQSYDSFAGPGTGCSSLYMNFWQTSLLCIVIELSAGGSMIARAISYKQ